MVDEPTRATTDRMSSEPSPMPRTRPTNRKPTVTANKTHKTDIAMSESRALPVIGIGSVLMNIIAGRKEDDMCEDCKVVRPEIRAREVLKGCLSQMPSYPTQIPSGFSLVALTVATWLGEKGMCSPAVR